MTDGAMNSWDVYVELFQHYATCNDFKSSYKNLLKRNFYKNF